MQCFRRTDYWDLTSTEAAVGYADSCAVVVAYLSMYLSDELCVNHLIKCCLFIFTLNGNSEMSPLH